MATKRVTGLVDRLRPVVASESGGPEVQASLRAESDGLVGGLRADEFEPSTAYSDDELLRRVTRYEESSAVLARAMALIGFWAPVSTARAASAVITEVAMARERNGGQRVWLDLLPYPATLLFYAFGIGAVAGQRDENLGVLLKQEVRDYRGRWRAAVMELNNLGPMQHDVAQRLPGMERHYTPVSDWLSTAVRPALAPLLPHDTIYDRAFDRFEILVGLGALLEPSKVGNWAPTGRFLWRGRYEEDSSHPLLAGPERDPTVLSLATDFGRSVDEVVEVAKRYVEIVSRARQGMF